MSHSSRRGVLFPVAYEQADGTSFDGAWLLPADGHGTARLVATGAENDVFSPDGRWLAYASNASGRAEVYVQAVDGAAGKRQVSVDGGTDPLWSHDGRELYFRDGKNMLSASVETRGGLRTGRPQVLFEWNYDYGRRTPNYDVAPDGRFLMVQVPESAERSRLVVVINWFEELKRLLPEKHQSPSVLGRFEREAKVLASFPLFRWSSPRITCVTPISQSSITRQKLSTWGTPVSTDAAPDARTSHRESSREAGLVRREDGWGRFLMRDFVLLPHGQRCCAPSLAQAAACPAAYQPRNPRQSSFYRLLETHFETLKRLWEERFERRYGFWQAYWDSAVFSYMDCGVFESGFARVLCPECRFEFLVAFSCKGRGLCPSCGAKRAALFSQLLQSKILADVPHAQWVFTLPTMLRRYFLYHRELLGELARLAYETVHQMMVAAVEEPDARPGMVAVIQTFGSSLKWNPHLHAIVTRGLFLPNGSWLPIPYVDSHKAELLFRHKVLALLRDRELITQGRIELLRSWRNWPVSTRSSF